MLEARGEEAEPAPGAEGARGGARKRRRGEAEEEAAHEREEASAGETAERGARGGVAGPAGLALLSQLHEAVSRSVQEVHALGPAPIPALAAEVRGEKREAEEAGPAEEGAQSNSLVVQVEGVAWG